MTKGENMDFEIKDIPEGHKCGWSVMVDGEQVDVRKVEITSRYGILTYGMRPEGYDGWAFAEPGGGGAITIPLSMMPNGELLVGMILEDRPNMGGKRWCAIGGFKEPGESALSTAVREAFEETGYNIGMSEVQQLEGQPGNFNRLFSVSDPENDEGVHAFVSFLPFNLLTEFEDGYGFREDVGGEDRKVLLSKGDGHVRFMPWRKAALACSDVLFSHGLMQVLAAADSLK